MPRSLATGPDGRTLMLLFEFIAAEPDRSAMEKFEAIQMVLKLPRDGFVYIDNVRTFLGWETVADRRS
jgi:hypothetical protein